MYCKSCRRAGTNWNVADVLTQISWPNHAFSVWKTEMEIMCLDSPLCPLAINQFCYIGDILNSSVICSSLLLFIDYPKIELPLGSIKI